MPFCTKLTATGKAIYLVFHHFPFSHWERIQQNVIGWHDHPILAKSAGGLNIICQFNQMENLNLTPREFLVLRRTKKKDFTSQLNLTQQLKLNQYCYSGTLIPNFD